MTAVDVYRILSSGAIVPDDISITIPEGYSISEINRLLNIELGRDEIDLKRNTRYTDPYSAYWFLSGLDEGDRLEGYLFPDTYRFSKGSDAITVIQAMLSGMENALSDLGIFPDGNFAAPIETIHELLTLASLVQKERPKSEMAI
ncbi:MAG: endolytic transglycosylase MltG, partial [Spirochaetaceae bacterium]|nr:endolytic transglycosylase MltG [Spirochaetaceae bacterium]